MKTEYFKTFITVVNEKSLSKAGKILNLTQPAITKHLQSLEEHYNTILLERNVKGIKLTEDGTLLYKYAQELLSILEEAEQNISGNKENPKGILNIGASNIPGQYLLPLILGKYSKLYPQVKVNLEISDTGEVVAKILEGVYDVGAVGSEIKNPRLEFIPFYRDELVFILPANHPLSQKEVLEPEDLLKVPLIWRERGSGTRMFLEKVLKNFGIQEKKLNIVMELGSNQAVLTAVEGGLGGAFCSEIAIRNAKKLGLISAHRIDGLGFQRDLYLIYLKRKKQHPLINSFINLTVSEFTNWGAKNNELAGKNR
ncbi:selenium metabolism-associated LysR family transcriptional regulator [Carboxydothermus pertinax]|uniref:LysR family transcriptional regulator n=1 Tax=Carboxydothermus pertinax TaxID=870242 RepID=A0A1L8CY29_9THEO|nr:selenium metabolism-associated LysR family transcriptional regulator [Carboxydothermus pertinax]GAV23769.1 LysR family transcriptional regulator [Carboxydothermus pertinax]